jgi:tetratricopeptide (TPR) repeat protein
MNERRGIGPFDARSSRGRQHITLAWFSRLFLWLSLFLGSVAVAQGTPLPPEARHMLEQAQQAAEEAKAQYAGVTNHIDQPLWRNALKQGEQALELAPEQPEVLRFMAESYSYLRWNIRAWDFWQRYVDAGGTFDDDVLQQLSCAGNELGYIRYAAGDPEGALDYYRQVHTINPTSTDTLTWLGRIHLELGQPAEALPYWQKLLTLDPDDEAGQYYLNRTEQQLTYGTSASDAFHQGLQLYGEENYPKALTLFQNAAAASPGFLEAHAWAGRVALELGQPEVARTHWLRVQELDPGDSRALYFLNVAADQSVYGFDAAQAYYAGLLLYENDDLPGALEQFQAAVSANSTFVNALDWVARVFAELDQTPQAIHYWEELLAREPANQRAQQHLNSAQDQQRFGAAAASAFSEGLRRYGLADYGGARSAFEEAVQHNPAYEEAWAWLGRIAFDQEDYTSAAEYYGQALELAPDNEDYRFFAEEARYLSTPEPAPEDEPVTSDEAADEADVPSIEAVVPEDRTPDEEP